MNKLDKTQKIIVVVGLYLLAQIIADVTAFKMIELFGLAIPAGSMIYALSFTNRDLAHKQIGYKGTITLIWAAGIINILMAAYFVMTIYLPSPDWFPFSEEYAIVLGIVPRIVIASIMAEMLSQILDTYVYQKWWEAKPNAPQWTRVLISNMVSIPLDSLIFGVIAFAGTYTVGQLVSLVTGQIVFKAALAVLSMPMIYLIPQNPEFAPETPKMSQL